MLKLLRSGMVLALQAITFGDFGALVEHLCVV